MTDTTLKLKQLISNIEYLEEQKKEKTAEISAVYKEAKALGFNTKIIREVIKIKNMEVNEREEHETLLNAYMGELGLM